MDTKILFVLKSEIEFNEKRMVDLDEYIFLSFYIRHLFLLNNVMFAEYLHCMNRNIV